ncbi:hypothetical protein APTSU1_001815000 [Apodemus speciosus]|uniref:Uncharacterized protein n=1 Tax=Apodemus speciosus TaxID=105296 RepID=A0ABQ0FUI0_APOSI
MRLYSFLSSSVIDAQVPQNPILTTEAQIQNFELVYLNIYPIYELLQELHDTGYQQTERSPSEDLTLIV